MRNPPDIKRGLFICADLEGNCPYCPYAKEGKRDPYEMCVSNLVINALHYIQQLETENHQLLKARAPRWISVEERLPEGECLAGCFAHGSYGYGEYIIGYVAPYRESEGNGYCAENSFVLLDDVTHWMPLPEPPKEDDK